MIASLLAPLRTVSIATKLLLISAALLLPLAVLLYFTVTSINANVDAAEMERSGVEYAAPLMALNARLPQHRMLAVRLLGGDEAVRAELGQIERAIDGSLSGLQAVHAEHSRSLQFDAASLQQRGRAGIAPADLAKEWDAITERLDRLTARPSDEAIPSILSDYEAVITRTASAITHVTDASKLILDPDLDSYYLMDVAVLSLPKLQRHLGDVAFNLEQAFAAGDVTGETAITLSVDAALLDEEIAAVVAAVTSAVAEDGNFHGSSGSIASVSTEAATLAEIIPTLADELRAYSTGKLAASNAGDGSGDAKARLRELVTASLQESADLFDVTAIELDKQLQTRAGAYRNDRRLALLLTAIALLVAGGLIAVVSSSITTPITRVVLGLQELAAKRFDHRVVEDEGGEIGSIFAAMNGTSEEIETAMRTIHGKAERLGQKGDLQNEVAMQLSAAAEETFSQASVVSTAAEQVSQNTETVAASIEELTASIREISGNASEAARMAHEAVEISTATTGSVGELRDSSGEIDEVVQVIQSIAEQTNLLALNATIEAARAGEAGKGFAVVAQAVKELSRETAAATEDIGRKIEAIQRDTGQAIGGIEKVSEMVTKISDYQHSIASAVEQQTVTTREIGQNVSDAAAGSRDISENITAVAEVAQQTAEGASTAQAAAVETLELACQLRTLVSEFQFSEQAGATDA